MIFGQYKLRNCQFTCNSASIKKGISLKMGWRYARRSVQRNAGCRWTCTFLVGEFESCA